MPAATIPSLNKCCCSAMAAAAAAVGGGGAATGPGAGGSISWRWFLRWICRRAALENVSGHRGQWRERAEDIAEGGVGGVGVTTGRGGDDVGASRLLGNSVALLGICVVGGENKVVLVAAEAIGGGGVLLFEAEVGFVRRAWAAAAAADVALSSGGDGVAPAESPGCNVIRRKKRVAFN